AARGLDCEDPADVHAVLAVGVHPAPDELEIGVEQDAFDGGLADAAGGPLDDAHGATVATRTCSCLWLRAQRVVTTPTVFAEKRGKTVAVDAPNRFDTISARTL